MNVTTISATEARNRWFEILNLVYFKGEEVVIEKNEKPIVRMTAVGQPTIMSAEEVIRKTAGFLKGKKGYWPSEDPKVRRRELLRMKRLWRQ